MKRRILSLLLALTMALTLLPATALAEGEGDPSTGQEETDGTEVPQTEGESKSEPVPLIDKDDVAAIEEQGYATLAEAVEAAQDGETITLVDDVTIDSPLTLSGEEMDITIDLDGHTLTSTIAGTGGSIDLTDGASLTVMDGIIEANECEETYYSVVYINTGCSFTLDQVTFNSTGTPLAPAGDAAQVNVRNGSVINAGAYCVATNAGKTDNYNVEINLENSEFNASSAVFLNVPGTLNMDNCVVNGTMHGVVVRGGTAVISGCEITLNYPDDDAEKISHYFDETNWGAGNMLNLAALTMGNKHPSSYQYPTDVTLVNTTLASVGQYGEYFPAVYVWANSGEGLGVTVSYKNCTFDGPVVYGNDGANISATVESGPVVDSDGNYYLTLADAVEAVIDSKTKTGTVTLLEDCSGGGIGLFNGKGATDVDLTIDFGGYTYTCEDPAVGSTGTESQGFHLEKGNTVILKNGTIKVAEDSVNTKMLIQNYCNLTLEDLTLVGGDITQYIVSCNYGDMVLENVNINGSYGSSLVGIDLMHWLGTTYADKAPTMVIHNTDKNMISGSMDVYCYGTGAGTCTEQPTLTIYGGSFSSDPTEYLAEDCTTALGTDGLYRVGLPVTVTFDSDGGSAVEPKELPYSAQAEEPDAPTKAGYAFVGWYLDGEPYNFDNMVTENITLVAKWNVVVTPVAPPADVEEVQVSTGENQSDIAEDLKGNETAQDVAEALEQSGVQQSGTGVSDAAEEVAADGTVITDEVVTEAKDKLELTEGKKVTIVVETYLDVTVTGAESGSSFTLDITPMYRLKATVDGRPPVDVGQPKELTVTEPVKLTIPLPGGFAGDLTRLFIHHLKDGLTYVYEGTVEGGKLTFNNPHGFSLFTITAEPPEASVEGIGYATLQDAVEAVRYGETIVVHESGLSAEASGNKLFYVEMDEGAAAPTLTAAEGYDLVVKELEDGTLQCVVSRQQAFSGGTAPVREIAVEDSENGSVEVFPEEAKQGTTVTITPDPDRGYAVEAVLVTAEDGGDVAVTEEDDGTYTFRMPNSDVTVEVTFRPATGGAAVSGDLTITAPAGWVNPYGDVAAGDWYYGAVGYATANGLMTGTSATTFAPAGTMNRAMVWTVIARLDGQTVAGASWAEDARTWAMAAGVSDGTNPTGSVTREELVTMLYRYAGSPAMNVPELALVNGYRDGGSVSDWAQEALAWALSRGIIEGREGLLAAGESVTRAEAATILARFHLAV